MSDDEREYRRRDKFFTERRGQLRDKVEIPVWRTRLPPPVGVQGAHHGPPFLHHGPPPPHPEASGQGYRNIPPPRVFRVPPPSGLPYLDRREGREVRNTRVELHKRETRDEREISQNLPTLPSNKRRYPDGGGVKGAEHEPLEPSRKIPRVLESEGKNGFQPVMMSFKAFLETQDDNITDEESLVKFAEYKSEFKRQQLNQFFVLHRDEEWFQLKYHPEILQNYRNTAMKNIQKRLDVFLEMEKTGLFDDLSLDEEHESQIIELMDIFVLKLEDASQEVIDKWRQSSETDKMGETLGTPRTSSIFLKTLHPSVTKSELERVCGKYPGFLRIAISEPAAEKNWFRRAWLTYRRQSKVKEICFNLNNLRIKDGELGPLVNKDLSKRVRCVPQFLRDREVMKHDTSMVTKLISSLDARWKLWQDTANINTTTNPLLANVHDFLVEEVSAEEEELLGKDFCKTGEDPETARTVQHDQHLAKTLDKLILYIRFVHSIDFYNRTEYVNEDDMPNRCGILHVRGTTNDSTISEEQIEKYNNETNKKFEILLRNKSEVSDDEVQKLGLKNETDEVEKFILANCQELGKDKWLCPLSGKKFKAPDFVKKHIFNKFSDLVKEVKIETEFFNKYLRDPTRPELPVQVSKPKPKAEKHVTPMTSTPRLPVKARLGVPGLPIGPHGVKITHASRDPREIVDYSDVDLSSAFDLF